MNFLREDGALQKRSQHVRQQQVRHSLELVTGRGMPRDLNSQRAQLLNQSPDLRAIGADLVGDLGAADDDGGVVHEQPDDPPQAQIRPLRRRLCGAGAPARERCLEFRPVAAFLMRGIMRERGQKEQMLAIG